MKLLVKNIALIVGIDTQNRERICNGDMNNVDMCCDAWLTAENGRITGFGSIHDKNQPDEKDFDQVVDAKGGMLYPSFCDSHTHIVYAGSREREFLDKIHGLSYEEIA
ncbi:MAG: imidazolonepropionase, partial [Rikenellaceae bacterium]|nr:imidazolonepropionase [Rikenellaceae bacterium]